MASEEPMNIVGKCDGSSMMHMQSFVSCLADFFSIYYDATGTLAATAKLATLGLFVSLKMWVKVRPNANSNAKTTDFAVRESRT